MLRDELNQAMKAAMRAKEARKLSTIRLVLAAIKEKDIELRTANADERDDDAMITDILSKMVKQRNDSIKAYEEGGRCELAEREREEIATIQEFLPKQLSDAEITSACREVVAEIGAEGLKDIGRCMAVLKERYAGQMDFAKASGMIKKLLS
ncbi:GatB/YqeY domain-containing protein [Kordiimonas aestuarii]|uniref:GatB/YqeY domain-containing protein n=1 Tax=Kordiimonas aestuarii TaxID=1005925 RepID=UPI0021D3C798|nr:GatB/YqeY domain-containing protein [Kordiimonas aestuarii]